MADQSIGALWKGKTDKVAFSGNVEIDGKKTAIVVFKNSYKKEGDRQPDYKIYVSKAQESRPSNDPDDISDVAPF